MAGKKIKNKKTIRKKDRVSAGTMGKILLPLILLLIVLGGCYYYIIKNYTVHTVYVEGNIHYTNEEVMAMVMEGYYGSNSLYLSLKYRDKSVENIPFVEKMDVSVVDPHTIKIQVYEKSLAGFVEYLDRYMYFDRDGTIVESSEMQTAGVPEVTGLKFDHVVMYE